VTGPVGSGNPTNDLHFSVAEHWVERVVVVAVSGELDLITAPDLLDAVYAAVRKEPAAMIVDLTRVTFLASAGINVLVAAHREVGRSARFGVVADGPATSRPMKLLGIDEIVPLYPTLTDAMADFADA
jgi:anti-sigma B factor antagonist